MQEKQEREAVFWCSLLRPVLFGEIPRGAVASFLRELAAQPVTFPDGRRRRPSVSTLKRKLRTYRKAGFEAIFRKPRKDKGKPRAVSEAVLATAIQAKTEQPFRSAEMINLILQARHGRTIPRSTLYRHLRRAGATRRKLGVEKTPVRKRWTVAHTHEMWIGDFSHGPYVLEGGLSVPTRLSAFLDVYSGVPVSARYYRRENADVLCASLVHAMGLHGAPRALYVDNARVYHGHALKRLCYRVGINLLHRKVRDPAGGGQVERFFQTAQGQFEAEVRAGDQLSLEALNRAFAAWVEMSYLATPHADADKTPQELYDQGLQGHRHVDAALIEECFLQWVKRTVDPTFSDVRLHNRFYRADPKLRGDRVWVAYDLRGASDAVRLYSMDKTYLGRAHRHERETGQQPTGRPPQATEHKVLDILQERQRAQHEETPIDYKAAATRTRWPLASFLQLLAELLGRTGGASAFSEAELAALQAAYEHHPGLTQRRVKRAFRAAASKSLPVIVYQLQKED